MFHFEATRGLFLDRLRNFKLLQKTRMASPTQTSAPHQSSPSIPVGETVNVDCGPQHTCPPNVQKALIQGESSALLAQDIVRYPHDVIRYSEYRTIS
ncbi:hypothetical protein AVEN_254716-1 [Araneus ventricosus]|uniref:Uncharacterized protein n=1 Tax=Araneus ventricosus TaxID=182803 RepID=A0A4Y2NAA4_ARAVE|nr:hypothetical protein AVEN_254716-1 [Araneus ventricosus]